MQVHISVTHQELHAHADRVGRALRDVGDEIAFATIDSGRRDEIERVRQADVLLCLVGAVEDLRGDGTVPGEWELAAAKERQLPVIAYALSTVDGEPDRHGRGGYVRARLVHFRESLRRETEIRFYHEPEDLHARVLRDLERVRSKRRAAAPEAFRSILRRLRSHPTVRFDALALSMHNMDTMYRVHRITPNSETSGKFVAREPGGAGANTMVALSRLGLKTAVVGAVGDDPVGVDLRTFLEDDDVDVSLLITIDDAESGRGVLIRDDHQNYLNLMSGGANDRLAEALARPGQLERVREAMQHARIIHHSSFTGQAERHLEERLTEELPAEAVLTFTPSTLHAEHGADRLEALVSRCDLLVVAEAELDLLLSNAPRRADRRLVDRLDALFQWRGRRGYTSPLIVVTYGGMKDIEQHDVLTIAWGADAYEGAVEGDRSLRLQSESVWDATGTRDAAVAGVLYGLLRGRTPTDCANLGYVLAMSASSAFGSRAGLPRRSLVRDRWRELMQVPEPPRWLDPYG